MAQSALEQRDFISLITQHQAPLRGYIISLMPGVEGVSDVLQETNLVLWEKREGFKPGTNFTAWSYTIARFQVKNHRRKILRHYKVNNTLDEDVAEELAEHCALTPESSEQRIQALEGCVKKLRSEDQELVRHRYQKNSPLAEYAESLGRSVSSLSVTLHRIRQKLRGCVNAKLNTTSFTQ